MYKLVFQPFGTQVSVQEEMTVLQAAQKAGIRILACCGGKKSCGKCKIKVAEGNFEKFRVTSLKGHLSAVTEEEKKQLTESELQSGYRLACAAEVTGDAVIEIPDESRMQRNVILEEGNAQEVPLKPAVRVYSLELEKATLEDNRDDFRRVKDALLGRYKELDEDLTIDFEALKELPIAIRAGKWKISLYMLYGRKILGVAPGKIENDYGAAVDIGTTTVVAYLCDLITGEVLQTDSFINPQVQYGDDVISRVSYCMSAPESLETLRGILVRKLNESLGKMASACGIHSSEICETVLVFNTVMECIALGISPKALGVSPFISPFSKGMDIQARDLGIHIMPGGNVHCLPSEAGFVGADNVAVLIAEEPYKQDKMELIIDIGTNSEICLGNRDKLYVTSCATGPALEGAQIKCGMRAAKGAIEAVKIDSATLEPQIKIIGGDAQAPVGICGSGILDAVAQMAETGIIDPKGDFSSHADSPRIRVGERGQKEYVLYFKKDPSEHDIVVTLADVRAVQLAKAALYAGAKILMARCGVSRLDKVILAGAFGSYINKENALKLGLFPDCRRDAVTVSGNAAGAGAKLALCNLDKRAEAETVSKSVQFVETATESDFSKCFLNAMSIPNRCDAFTVNKPISFPCPGLHMGGKKPDVPDYPYHSLDELLADDVDLSEIVRKVIAKNSRANLPGWMVDISGPFAALGYLISPVSLYCCGRKDAAKLEKVLSLITKALVSYAKEAISNGVVILSFADPAGDMEQVGMNFYKKFSGKSNLAFLKEIEPFLKESLVHLCGKTSYSMEKAGYMLARPYRVDNDQKYLDALREQAKDHKVKFIGHACINQANRKKPILYRLEIR